MGAKVYRASVSWPRVMPDGIGTVNDAGLAYYDRLVDALLERGVTPWLTLFHWDYPLALQQRGGWLSADSPKWFEDYARVVVARLSDRVTHWMTINEPQVFLSAGHLMGVHPPSLRLERPDMLRAIHHTLLAHGRAVRAIREVAKRPPTIGWATATRTYLPVSDAPADIEAARRRTFTVTGTGEWTFNDALYADPIHKGAYPAEMHTIFGADMPRIAPGDMETIASPTDFLGINVYFGLPVRAGADGAAVDVPKPMGYPSTMIPWQVTPSVMHWAPRFLHERYRVPMYITENGCAGMDWVHADGKVHDAHRVDFLTRYLRELRGSIAAGADVRGYLHWSVMDNFEWSEGFRMRFGLIHVDYATLARTPKDSYHWYAKVIATNGGEIPETVAPMAEWRT
jgi:beta-glucosidase